MSTDAAGSTGVPDADASHGQGTGAWAAAGAPYRWRWAAFAVVLVAASRAAQDWPAGAHDGEAGT